MQAKSHPLQYKSVCYRICPAFAKQNLHYPLDFLAEKRYTYQVAMTWACSSVGRAFGSHPRGQGFESLQVHQTVRTRTRFFMKKGSGTFFVYRRFCGESTRSGKQAKAGYHHGDGILPFVLRNQVRFVRTWSSPLYGAFEGNRCVRAYRRAVHLWQGVTH